MKDKIEIDVDQYHWNAIYKLLNDTKASMYRTKGMKKNCIH